MDLFIEDKETGKLKDGILESMEEDDESKPEKFDEGKRGGAETKSSGETQYADRARRWLSFKLDLYSLLSHRPPSKKILLTITTTRFVPCRH